MIHPPLILASTSPRRQELLALLQIPFRIIPPTVIETVRDQESPINYVRRLAFEKALSVASRIPASLIIGSDTIIEIDDAIFGKPSDLREAHDMLKALRGRCHKVHTGLALISQGNPNIEERLVETVMVWIKNFSDSELEAYLQTHDSLGKAGAYSIQGKGSFLVEKIEGDYPAVVGLPLRRLAKVLEKTGIDLHSTVAEIYRTKPYNNWAHFA